MSEDFESFEEEVYIPKESKRPAFIKVLAILSWIYVGIAMIGGLINSLASSESQLESLDDAIAIYQDMDPDVMPFSEDMIEFLEASKENYKINGFLQLFLILIEGIAVFMMFNLKKIGFWLYTIAQLGILLLIVFLFPLDNFVTIISLVINGIIILIFEILYAVNLKHMK